MWVAWVLLGLLGMHPESEGPDVQFWSPPQCPDRAALLASTADYAPSTPRPGVVAGGYIRRTGDRYVLEFSITSPSGTTSVQLEHASCEVLVDAAAVKLALALEHALPIPPPPGQDDEDPLALPKAPEQPPPPLPRHWVGLDAAGGVDWGTVPGFGVALRAGVSLRRWSSVGARLYTIHVPERDVWRRAAPGEGAAFSSLGAGVLACYVWRAHPIALPWCGGLELAALRWRGLGRSREFGGRAIVPSLTMQTGLRWPAEGPVSISVAADLVVPLVRHQVALHQTPLEYRTRAVGVRTWLGFGVRL